MEAPLTRPAILSPRKRRRIAHPDSETRALQDVDSNVQPSQLACMFMEDSDEENGLECLRTLPKRGQDHALVPASFMLPLAPPHDIPIARLYTQQPTVAPLQAQTSLGRTLNICKRAPRKAVNYEEIIASRSVHATGKAKRSFYGVDIQALIGEAIRAQELEKEPQEGTGSSIESTDVLPTTSNSVKPTMMWTEKYRAKKFTDLVGDERTHRSVLKWLKGWDQVVFPGISRSKPTFREDPNMQSEERPHRKILLLTGPPGLGKTTLAHVCAKQAGYEVQEINASDERSREVVKGRLRDMVGTENIRGIGNNVKGARSKIARPTCVVVDEVDGVVTGSGGSGEGGFIKALVDLLSIDQKNSNRAGVTNTTIETKKKKKGDTFRLFRPLILICNDVYHPSLRLLRQGSYAEIIHVRKPALEMVIPRLHDIFRKEGIACDGDGVRSLCEATWGVNNRKENHSTTGTGDGDIRSILVTGEWAARKLQSQATVTSDPEQQQQQQLTKKWIQEHILGDLARNSGSGRSMGRGGSKEVVERVFSYNAGFPVTGSSQLKTKGASCQVDHSVDNDKSRALDNLHHMIQSSGEDDRIMSDCFATYATHTFQDDTYLTKPCKAYEWLHFHDTCSSLVHRHQEWEMAPYLTSPVLAFHHLFASNSRYSSTSHTKPSYEEANAAEEAPFSGVRASYLAAETTKANRELFNQLHSALSIHLHRTFRSSDDLAIELLPYLLRMLAPEVKPVVVGGSEKGVASVRRGVEKEMVNRAVSAMLACGISFERNKLDFDSSSSSTGQNGGWVYRMEPALDDMGVYATADKEGTVNGVRVRYAVRQVLSQEWQRERRRREQESAVRRMKGVNGEDIAILETSAQAVAVEKTEVQRVVKAKRDFFGRLVMAPHLPTEQSSEGEVSRKRAKTSNGRVMKEQQGGRVWVTFHEGFSNAVRKPITLKELLDGM